MEVLALPDYSLHNPYQWLLSTALARRGVRVTHSDGIGKVPVLGAVRAYGRPDVVHLHWPDHFVQRTGAARSFAATIRFVAELAVLRVRGVRIVWTAHNLHAHDGQHARVDWLAHALLSRVVQRVIVHSQASQSSLVRHVRLGRRGSKKVLVIAHGRFDDAYPLTIDRAEARGALQLDPSAPVFLAFGQVRRYRGILELLDAFEALPDPNARLLVVGRPADEQLATRVEAAARDDDRVRAYLSYCSADDVQRYFLAADAVVLPYRNVLTSGVAVLAARFGRACIAPDSAQLREVLPQDALLSYDATQPDGLLTALQQATSVDFEFRGRRLGGGAFAPWADVADLTVSAYGIEALSPVQSVEEPLSAAPPWWQRLLLARGDVESVVPAGAQLTVVDDGSMIDVLGLPRSRAFPARDGVPWGPPASDAEAVQALERLLAEGSRWLVVPWPSFWWFEVYPAFSRRLRAVGTCVRRTDRVAVFELCGDRRAA
jgi:glycosyltransferase involved in cell wall biosynthesis